MVEGSSSQPSRHLENGKGAVVVANLAVSPAPEEPLVMPGSKIDDPNFLVMDVVPRHLNSPLRLPPLFNLPIQAIYTHFHQDSWETFAGKSIMERQCLTVMRQILPLSLPSKIT